MHFASGTGLPACLSATVWLVEHINHTLSAACRQPVGVWNSQRAIWCQLVSAIASKRGTCGRCIRARLGWFHRAE
jgi:hypothetical protein